MCSIPFTACFKFSFAKEMKTDNRLQSFLSSRPVDVANDMLHVIKHATSGSVWVSDKAGPLQVDFSSGIKYM